MAGERTHQGRTAPSPLATAHAALRAVKPMSVRPPPRFTPARSWPKVALVGTRCPRDVVSATRTSGSIRRAPRRFSRAALICTPHPGSREADAMRKLTYGMNLSLDGYIAAPGDDLGWSVPSDELFQWWSDRVGATGVALYGRRLWETMSAHWPTADQQPGVTPAHIEFARRWRHVPKVVFSST